MKRFLPVLILAISCQFSIAQQFVEVTSTAGINHVYDFGDFMTGAGVAILDYNNDGLEDMYATGGVQTDALYRNNGDGTFTDVIASTGLVPVLDSFVTVGVVAGDIDNDGDRDLYVTTKSYAQNLNVWSPNLLFENNGDGTFTNITSSSGMVNDLGYSTSATLGDYNLDGYLDIYVLNFIGVPIYNVVDSNTFQWTTTSRPGSSNQLYLNNGNNTFTDVAATLGVDDGGCGWATAFSDYDNDHDVDIVVANDFGTKTEPNDLYENQYPTNSFVSKGAASGTDIKINAMGVAAGDINEDGYLDYYITDMTDNFLFQNNGDGTFTDITDAAEVADSGWVENGFYYISVGWGANFFDYDLDTYLDLFVCNGSIVPMVPATTIDTFYNPNTLYRNIGNATFQDRSVDQGVNDPHRGRGSAVFDYDQDGDLDLVVANQVHFPGYGGGTNPHLMLYRNDHQNDGNWVHIKLQGAIANYDGIGAKVYVKFNGRTLMREIDGGSSHLSQNSTIAHFGLGSATDIDTIMVVWPGGKTQYMLDTTANNIITILENTVPDGFEEYKNNHAFELFPNPSKGQFQLLIKDKSMATSRVDISIFDNTGRIVKRINNVRQGDVVDWSDAKSGLYYYELSAGETLLSVGKLIKE